VILLGVLTFGLSFIMADARLFGCPARAYPGGLGTGVMPIRDRLLPMPFFRQQLGCYFCIGFWCAAVAHVLLLISGVNYSLSHASTLTGYASGLGVAMPVGGAIAYCLDLLTTAAEVATK